MILKIDFNTECKTVAPEKRTWIADSGRKMFHITVQRRVWWTCLYKKTEKIPCVISVRSVCTIWFCWLWGTGRIHITAFKIRKLICSGLISFRGCNLSIKNLRITFWHPNPVKKKTGILTWNQIRFIIKSLMHTRKRWNRDA